MDFQAIIAGTVGKDKHLRHLRGPRQIGRDEASRVFSTDDLSGKVRG